MTHSRFGIVLAAVLLSGCGRAPVTAGATQHETAVIDLEKTDSGRVELNMGAGELTVKSGTSKFVDAAFTFNVPAWKPVVEYHAGSLTITQPSSGGSFGNTEYKWDLKLTDQVPLDINATLGAGEATLELGRMDLKSVEVKVGAGEVKMDLRGDPKHDYIVKIQGGVGEATVQLPKNVAISATASGGLGEISTSGLEQRDGVWINPDKVGGPVTVKVEVRGGIGSIRLER